MIRKPYDDDDDQGDFDDNRPKGGCAVSYVNNTVHPLSPLYAPRNVWVAVVLKTKKLIGEQHIHFKNIYICCSPTSLLDFFKLTLLRQKECRRELLWVFRDWLGPPGCVDLLAALSAPNIWFHHRHNERSDITKDCLFHPGKERLALGSV